MVLYFVGTPESALMIERVGFAGDKLIRVEEHPPDANHCQLGLCVSPCQTTTLTCTNTAWSTQQARVAMNGCSPRTS